MSIYDEPFERPSSAASTLPSAVSRHTDSARLESPKNNINAKRPKSASYATRNKMLPKLELDLAKEYNETRLKKKHKEDDNMSQCTVSTKTSLMAPREWNRFQTSSDAYGYLCWNPPIITSPLPNVNSPTNVKYESMDDHIEDGRRSSLSCKSPFGKKQICQHDFYDANRIMLM